MDIHQIAHKNWDNVIIGAGHNGLICANYLAKAGQSVLVLERRSFMGGAAATEEVFPGYRFSRYSYVLSIFRSAITEEIFPENWREELQLYPTEPSLLIPTKESKRYVLLYNDSAKTKESIAEFESAEEAEAYIKFIDELTKVSDVIQPLVDEAPIQTLWQAVKQLPKMCMPKGVSVNEIVGFFSSSSANVLNRRFANENLKAALSYSGTVGQMQSPYTAGSAYLQLHHVSNTIEVQGQKSRYYPRGGMGAVGDYLAKLATDRGAVIVKDQGVDKIDIENNQVVGVSLTVANGQNGEGERLDISAKRVISNATFEVTFNQLIDQPETVLPQAFNNGLKSINYTTNCSKVNLVLKDVPVFNCLKEKFAEATTLEERLSIARQYMHNTLIVGEHMKDLDRNFHSAGLGKVPDKPTIQMLIPSLLDDSLIDSDKSGVVALLFVQYTPYDVKGGWNKRNRDRLLDRVFGHLEEYVEGFRDLVEHVDLVTPVDIEKNLNLTGGNIFHGAMDLDNIYSNRPIAGYSNYQSPVSNLYVCSAASHPGGGVSGGPGRNAALAILGK